MTDDSGIDIALLPRFQALLNNPFSSEEGGFGAIGSFEGGRSDSSTTVVSERVAFPLASDVRLEEVDEWANWEYPTKVGSQIRPPFQASHLRSSIGEVKGYSG